MEDVSGQIDSLLAQDYRQQPIAAQRPIGRIGGKAPPPKGENKAASPSSRRG